VVDVAGAVPRPGVYEFPDGARVKDAIQAAGGLLAEADKSTLNLAAPLADGQRLDIPYLSGMQPTPEPFSFSPGIGGAANGTTGGQSSNTGELIDINNASLEELETLPGIGQSLAQAIIDYRNEFGPFFAIEDIMFVDGIGPATFEDIKNMITVGF
jgi:competence protein ComEA